MKTGLIKTVGTYAVCWGTIVSFTILLTLVFSFLGTLMCTLLAGMMMGAVKPSKWLSVPISIMFPTIILALTRWTRTEFTPGQIAGLACLCLAAFWGIYLGAALVVSTEKKSSRVSADRAAGLPAPAIAQPLEVIQGKWTRDTHDPAGHAEKQVIEIHDHDLTVLVIDEQGHKRLAAHGAVQLGGAT
jgi:hypothetical protein